MTMVSELMGLVSSQHLQWRMHGCRRESSKWQSGKLERLGMPDNKEATGDGGGMERTALGQF